MTGESADLREVERRHAEHAIEEARSCPGTVRVGAVLARGEAVIATGFKGERSGLHAEQVALLKAQEQDLDVTGAELYVTLEPCANSRTSRIPCCQLISDAGVAVVHIGQYDPNPQIHRRGWKHLRDRGVALRDFPADLRDAAAEVSSNFSAHFTRGIGMSAGAKFDFTQNGGRFTISADESADSPSWETIWRNCGASAIYLYGGDRGVVALARYATNFREIDDPDALDYGDTSAEVAVGDIGVMRNEHGHVLCKVIAIEPTPRYGGTGHVSVKIEWEIRLRQPERSGLANVSDADH